MDIAFPRSPLMLDPRAHARLPTLAADIRAALAVLPMERPGAKGYEVSNGVALIEVSGILVPKLGLLQSLGFVTGYDGIRANLGMALADDAVEVIAFMVDSPGGYTSGMHDLGEKIHALRGRKPMVAILDDMAASAAYCLASAADWITVPGTGTTGSVGVFTVLMDVSESLAKAGVRPHVVHFGAAKAADMRAELTGATPEALASIQVEINALGEMFVSTVARNRGLSADAVRVQEGRCYFGAAGVDAGLADAVMPADDALRALLTDPDAD